MDFAEIVQKILEELEELISTNPKLRSLIEQSSGDDASYKIANEYTKILSELSWKIINNNVVGNLPNDRFTQELADIIFLPVLQKDFEQISAVCEQVQQSLNKQAQTGIKAKKTSYNKYNSYKVSNKACSYAEYNEEAQEGTLSEMRSSNLRYVDNSIRENAEFQYESGLTPRVTRTYDGIGLRNRKVACNWCLQRVGHNVPYPEAKAKGMFERHEGCGCEIEYVNAQGVKTYQSKKGGWETAKEREKRITLIEGKGDSQGREKREATAEAINLIEQARKQDKTVTKDLQEAVSQGTGHLEGLKYRIKGEESLERKLLSKSKEKGYSIAEYAQRVTDVLRYTNVSSVSSLTDDYFIIIEGLEKKGYNLIEVSNTFNVYGAYKGVNTLVQTPSGYVFELQYHTPQSLEIKEINHKLYEEFRLQSTGEERKKELFIEMRKNAEAVIKPKDIERIEDLK